MLELILDAAKVLTSKDTRESAAALFSTLKEAPEWKRETCELAAKIPRAEQKLMHLLRDVIVAKLAGLFYSPQVQERFSMVFDELVLNAFQHGCSKAKSVIEIRTHFSSSIVWFTVLNPHSVQVDLGKWLREANERLLSKGHSLRGRGLIVADRKADELRQDGDYGIEATFYRREALFLRIDVRGVVILVLCAGAENPAFGKRLRDHVDEIGEAPLILALRTDLLDGATREFLEDNGIDVSFAAIDSGMVGHLGEGSYWPISTFCIHLCEVFGEGILIPEAQTAGFDTRILRRLRIVISDRHVRDLFSFQIVATSILHAYESLEIGGPSC